MVSIWVHFQNWQFSTQQFQEKNSYFNSFQKIGFQLFRRNIVARLPIVTMTIVLPRPTLFQLARLPIVTMTIVLPRPTDIVPTSSFSTCYYDSVWGGDTSRGALDVFHIGKGSSGLLLCATFFFVLQARPASGPAWGQARSNQSMEK